MLRIMRTEKRIMELKKKITTATVCWQLTAAPVTTYRNIYTYVLYFSSYHNAYIGKE